MDDMWTRIGTYDSKRQSLVHVASPVAVTLLLVYRWHLVNVMTPLGG